MSEELTGSVVLETLGRALDPRRSRSALTGHSGRASQYASDDYRALLGAEEIVCSMSPGATAGTRRGREFLWHAEDRAR